MSTAVDIGLVAKSLGTIEIGVLFNSVLLGVVFMQWISYFTSKYQDPWSIQALVYWTMVLDLAHCAISWQYLWMYTVEKFGDASTLIVSHWQYDSGPWFIVLTAAPIQLFLAWRIRNMLKGKPYRMGDVLFVCIMTLSLIQVIFGLYMSTSLLVGVKTTEEYKKFVSIAVAWESFALATDALIMCASIGTLLYRRTGFKQTDWIVFNLVLVAIECAVPVTLFTIGHMSAVISSPTTGIHQLFAWSQARLYSNTLFVNLNARGKLRRGQQATASSGANYPDNAVNILTHMERGQARSARPQVHIDVTREEHYAMDPISMKQSESDMYGKSEGI